MAKRNFIHMNGTEVGTEVPRVIQPSAPAKYRHFCMAVFTKEPVAWVPEKMGYLCYAPEICETTGRPHWQTYVYLKNPYTIKGASNLLGCGVEVCRGTPEDNRIYCHGPYDKDGKHKPVNPGFVEHGHLPEQGARNDVRQVYKSVEEGLTNREIIMRHGDNALRMHRAIEWARDAFNNFKRDWEMDVRIYWGPTNCSKTWTATHEWPDSTHKHKYDAKWWPGYNGQHCVVIDEFNPNLGPDIGYWLELMDRYELEVEYKGGHKPFVSKVLIFTSNYDPANWYYGHPQREAFFRRVTSIKYFCIPYKKDKGGADPPHAPPNQGSAASAAFGGGGSSPPPLP